MGLVLEIVDAVELAALEKVDVGEGVDVGDGEWFCVHG